MLAYTCHCSCIVAATVFYILYRDSYYLSHLIFTSIKSSYHHINGHLHRIIITISTNNITPILSSSYSNTVCLSVWQGHWYLGKFHLPWYVSSWRLEAEWFDPNELAYYGYIVLSLPLQREEHLDLKVVWSLCLYSCVTWIIIRNFKRRIDAFGNVPAQTYGISLE